MKCNKMILFILLVAYQSSGLAMSEQQNSKKPDSIPHGVDKGKKEGWTSDVPPGWDKGKKEGWTSDVPPGWDKSKKPKKGNHSSSAKSKGLKEKQHSKNKKNKKNKKKHKDNNL